MAKSKHIIRFQNLYQLWAYAQVIHALSIEISSSEMLLICDCSEEDLQMLSEFHGEVIDKINTVFNHTSINHYQILENMENNNQASKKNRGFAAMSPEKQKEIAKKGGRAAHEKRVAHEWSSEEAREAGKKGGMSRGKKES